MQRFYTASARSGLNTNDEESFVSANSLNIAREWLDLIRAQEVPDRLIVIEQIDSGEVTSLCDCGCHGFDFHVPRQAFVRPLQSETRLFCELAFESNFEDEIAVLLFVDAEGYLCRFDVTYGSANAEAMPEGILATRLKYICFSKR